MKIEGMITFTYYKDIEKAAEFYGNTLGFKQVMNHDWVKPQEEKPVMLSVFVEEVDNWYKKLNDKGVKTNHPPKKSDDMDMRGFLTWDPEGYVIEFLTFDTEPYGE